MPSTPNHDLEFIDLGIAERLRTDATFRARYLRAWARTEVANQIREMRQRRQMRQQDVARKTGTGQSAISRIEKADYEGWTFKTLLKIAEVLDARLEIALTPIESVVARHAQHEQQDAAAQLTDERTDTGFVGTVSEATFTAVGHVDDVSDMVHAHAGIVNTSQAANANYQGV